MMPTLHVIVPPPDGWQEVIVKNNEGVSHRIGVSAKLAPYQTKISPPRENLESIEVTFVCAQREEKPHIGFFENSFATVPVDRATLSWIKEHWLKGRRIEVDLHGEIAPGFAYGLAPDGSETAWDQTIANYIELSEAVLRVDGYKEGTETQEIEAPTAHAVAQHDLRASLSKIASRLDLLIGVIVIFAAYYRMKK